MTSDHHESQTLLFDLLLNHFEQVIMLENVHKVKFSQNYNFNSMINMQLMSRKVSEHLNEPRSVFHCLYASILGLWAISLAYLFEGIFMTKPLTLK